MIGFPKKTGKSSAGPWVDSHCHLTHGVDAAAADQRWHRARQAGVTTALLIGIDTRTSQEVADYVADRAGLYASVGIHPNHAGEAEPAERPRLAGLLEQPKVVALGETGVDLYRDRAPLDRQEDWLRWHADLALERDLPLVLHIRDAYQEAARCLEPFAAAGLRAVVHCFTGGPAQLDPFLGWGFLVSFSGVLTYANAEAVREAARRVPLEQCLVETDAPWLAPVPHRGGTNEPAFVVHTGEALARAQGRPVQEVAAATSANARRLFRLPDPGMTGMKGGLPA